MRKLLALLTCLLLASGVIQAQEPGGPSLGDPYYRDLGNSGYDVLHYTIDLAVEIEENLLDGTVTIIAQAQQDLSAFNLDFIGFTISDLTVNGAAAEFERDGRELIITPAEALPEGEEFTVAVTYSGSPRTSREGGPLASGWNNYGTGSYVASEPEGAAKWYPANDHPRDKATFTFRITVAEPYVVAANGLLAEVIEDGDHRTYVWESTSLMATYLAAVYIDDFVIEEEEGPGGLPIRNYYPPEIAERGTRVFAAQPEMIAYFSEIFGPYPFEAYGSVVVDTPLFFALENQTLSLFGSDILAPFSFGTDAEEIVAHELAHQWFGDSVSVANWKDIWLNEGFATYAQALWIEHEGGREALDEYMVNLYSAITNPLFTLGGDTLPGAPPPNNLFTGAVYLRGGWTLHALRLRVGDEVFFEIIQTYYDRFKYSNASTEDFLAVAQEVSGEDLGEFFSNWLFERRVPPVPEMGLGRAQSN